MSHSAGQSRVSRLYLGFFSSHQTSLLSSLRLGLDGHRHGRYPIAHGSAKATKIESSCLNEIPLQMLPMGMWGPENMKIKKFRWGLFEFYIFLS